MTSAGTNAKVIEYVPHDEVVVSAQQRMMHERQELPGTYSSP